MTYVLCRKACINKGIMELEEHEKFLQQALQVNAWDKMLVEMEKK